MDIENRILNGIIKNTKAQSLPKKIIFLGIMILLIGVGVWFVMGLPNIEQTNPTQTTIITPNDTVSFNFSINDNGEGISGFIFSLNDTNYSYLNHNLKGFYNFDNNSNFGENSTIVVDQSIYGLNLTSSTLQNFVEGKYNKAVYFDGSETFKAIAPALNGTGRGICFWFNASQEYDDSWQEMMAIKNPSNDINRMTFILRNQTDMIYMQFYNSTGTGVVTQTGYSDSIKNRDGSWHHVCGTYNSTKSYLYYDGVLVDSDTLTNFDATNQTGGFLLEGDWNGSLDDLMLFNTSLSANDVSNLFRTQISKYNSTFWQYNTTINNSGYLQNYFFCSSNLTRDTKCTSQGSVLELDTLTANFNVSVNSFPVIRSDFYGVGIQNPDRLQGGLLKDTNYDGSGDTLINHSWTQQMFLDGGNKITYYDGVLHSFYDGLQNLGFEDWSNYTGGFRSTSGSTGTRDWTITIGNSRNVTLNNVTDSHSGTYALQINASSSSGNVYPYTTFSGVTGNNYTFSIWLKGEGSIAQRISNSSVREKSNRVITLNSTWMQYNLSYLNIEENQTFYILLDLGSYVNVTMDDYQVYQNGTPLKWWRTGSGYENTSAQLTWDYEHNITSGIILASMPSFLSNWTTACKSSITDTDVDDCPPNDYTTWGEIILDYYKWADNYRNRTYVQMWNEPYGTSFEDQLTSNSAKMDFVTLFNNTYDTFKGYNSNIKMIGWRSNNANSSFDLMLFSNLTTKLADGISIHPYGTYTDNTDEVLSYTQNALNNCNYYNATCTYILIDEWQPNYAFKNVSNGLSQRYKTECTIPYIDILNFIPANASMLYYHYFDLISYFNAGTYYNEFPSFWSGISEAGLDNSTDPVLYPPYTTTKIMSEICPPGSTVRNVTLGDTDFKATSCTKANLMSLVVSSKVNETKNLSLTFGVDYTLNNITDYETKEIYSLVNSNLNLTFEPYDSYYLTSGIPPTITSVQPANLTINTTSNQINFTANLSDDVGLTNSTFYLLNTTDNTLSTFFTNYISGEKSVIQSFFTIVKDAIYKFWWSLFDDEGKQTTTKNYTLTVDTSIPTITFESPTPMNNSIVSFSTQTIVANISDSLNTSSFIDFDRSLILYLPIDYYNATGVYDNSTYDFFGLFKNGIKYSNISQGIRGNGLTFDGVNDYLSVTDVGSTLDFVKERDYTFSYWVYQKGSVISLLQKGNVQMISADNVLSFTETITPGWTRWRWTNNIVDYSNKWVNYVIVYEGSKNFITAYRNGVVLGNGSVTYNWSVNTNDSSSEWSLGKNYPMNGSQDEVMIFNRSLSATEISALYDSQSNKFNATFTNMLDGQHNYTVYAIDQAGNYNSSTQNFYVDTITPIINIIFPKNITYTVNLTNITYTLIDATSNYCWFSEDDGTINSSIVSAGTNFTMILNAGAFNTWKVWCNDSVNHLNSSSVSFSLNVLPGGGGAVDTGGGGGGTWDTTPINLDHLNITWDEFYYNKSGYIYVSPLDKNEKIVNLTNLSISILTPVKFTQGSIQKLVDGRWRQSFTIITSDITEFKVNIFATESTKQLEQNVIIPISEKKPIKLTPKEWVQNASEYIKDNWLLVAIISFIFFLILIVFSILVLMMRKKQ